jgi:glycosyltransferase involved in cell wall biosynthesis
VEKKRPIDIPAYLKASDLLVLPNKKGDRVSERYTSPLKLFEYMASGTAIVASDLPSIREVVDEESAWFFSSNDSESLVATIRTALFEKERSFRKAERAKEVVKGYTWQRRGEMIKRFIERAFIHVA